MKQPKTILSHFRKFLRLPALAAIIASTLVTSFAQIWLEQTRTAPCVITQSQNVQYRAVSGSRTKYQDRTFPLLWSDVLQVQKRIHPETAVEIVLSVCDRLPLLAFRLVYSQTASSYL